jgi:phosphatidylglycerol:prolipoprotein diacylglycerol transferase
LLFIFAAMALTNFIIWNGSPEIFSIGSFSLRWYGLLFALGFLLGQQILYYIFKKEGKPEKDVDTLTIYMIVATLLGARLGHVVFYQPELFIEDPLSILLPFEFSPKFRFTGLQGLASHGATIGILTALWLYARKRKPGQSFLQIVDRIVILVALTGALIRLGNYFNSEIIGKPADLPWSVAFVHNATQVIEFDEYVDNVAYLPGDSTLKNSPYQPVKILLTFKQDSTLTEQKLKNYIETRLSSMLSFNTSVTDHVYQTGDLLYRLGKEGDKFEAVLYTNVVPRHPAQLYESVSCLILFILLFFLWARDKEKLAPGRLFAIFLMVCFGLRFCYEFLKENQVAFEDKLPLNMGQILSIPLFIAGVVLFIWTFRKKTETN